MFGSLRTRTLAGFLLVFLTVAFGASGSREVLAEEGIASQTPNSGAELLVSDEISLSSANDVFLRAVEAEVAESVEDRLIMRQDMYWKYASAVGSILLLALTGAVTFSGFNGIRSIKEGARDEVEKKFNQMSMQIEKIIDSKTRNIVDELKDESTFTRTILMIERTKGDEKFTREAATQMTELLISLKSKESYVSTIEYKTAAESILDFFFKIGNWDGIIKADIDLNDIIIDHPGSVQTMVQAYMRIVLGETVYLDDKSEGRFIYYARICSALRYPEIHGAYMIAYLLWKKAPDYSKKIDNILDDATHFIDGDKRRFVDLLRDNARLDYLTQSPGAEDYRIVKKFQLVLDNYGDRIQQIEDSIAPPATT